MDVTPTTPKPRPTPAKSSAGKTTANPGKGVTKSRRGRKACAAEPQVIVAQPVEVLVAAGADINQRIATAAYFLAAMRNFEPGHELEDWLEAERRVRPRSTDRA
jgi:hypothetical protein